MIYGIVHIHAGTVRYARAERCAAPLIVITNWQHSAALPGGNALTGAFHTILRMVVTTFSEKEDLLLVPCPLPTDGRYTNYSFVLADYYITFVFQNVDS